MRTSAVLITVLLLASSALAAPLASGAEGALDARDGDGPATGGAPLIITVTNSTNYLTVSEPDIERTGTTTTGLDVSTALAADADDLSAELTRESFERRYREARSQNQRTALVRQYADRLEAQRQLQRQLNGQAIRAYANGSISTATFARKRAVIQARTSALASAASSINGIVDWRDPNAPPTSVELRLENVSHGVAADQGPVTGGIVRAAAAGDVSETVYVEASTTGYTMANVSETTYVRETFLGSERAQAGTDKFVQSDKYLLRAMVDRAWELYNWSTSSSDRRTRKLSQTGAYEFKRTVEGGNLDLYLDGVTTNVFREHQRLRPSSIPVRETVTERNGTLEVRLNRTYETGPMKVSLSRTSTGVTAIGNVTIDGQPVGTTGPNGSLWAIEPRRPYTLNATAESGGTVSVTVR